MKARLSLVCVLATLVATGAGLTVAPSASAATAAAPTPAAVTLPITGTGLNTSFVGQFALQSFRFANGQLSAVGQLTGTLTNTVTGISQPVNQLVTIPITNISVTETCDILHLELGPLDLDLLGLVVHLNRVVLDIDAQAGPGNLLGNLLCAVAHLLDRSSSGAGLANLLNRILSQL